MHNVTDCPCNSNDLKPLCIFIKTLISILKSALPVLCAVRGASEALYGQAPGEGIQVFREFDPNHRQTDRLSNTVTFFKYA